MTEPSFLPSSNPRVPKPDFPFRHRLPVQIRFTDVDMLGHLNNNIYLTFMDLAKVDYFGTVNGGPVDMHHINMVVVHIDINFLAPVFFGDNVEVWTRVTSIGSKSLHMEQRLIDSDTLETKGIGTVVMAGFDPSTSRSLPIDEKWVENIERFEHRSLRS